MGSRCDWCYSWRFYLSYCWWRVELRDCDFAVGPDDADDDGAVILASLHNHWNNQRLGEFSSLGTILNIFYIASAWLVIQVSQSHNLKYPNIGYFQLQKYAPPIS